VRDPEEFGRRRSHLPSLKDPSTGTTALVPEFEHPPPTHPLDGVVQCLRHGDERGVAGLFELLSDGAHFFVRRFLGDGPANPDIVRRVLLRAAQAALDGRIPDGAAMSGFVLKSIRELAPRIHEDSGRDSGELSRRHDALVNTLSRLPRRDREALRRYYALGHCPERICADLNIKEAAFPAILGRVRKLCARPRTPHALAHASGQS
jgi:DNA-directed RNA polymerase specialized sigma24 family protein